MQIIIKQSEIEVAVKNYIANLGINLTGKDVEVSFTAGRKEDGLSASLDIVDVTATAAPNPMPLASLGDVYVGSGITHTGNAAQTADAKPAQTTVKRTTLAAVPATEAVVETSTAEEVVEAAEALAEPATVETKKVEEDPAPKAKANSLFG